MVHHDMILQVLQLTCAGLARTVLGCDVSIKLCDVLVPLLSPAPPCGALRYAFSVRALQSGCGVTSVEYTVQWPNSNLSVPLAQRENRVSRGSRLAPTGF